MHFFFQQTVKKYIHVRTKIKRTRNAYKATLLGHGDRNNWRHLCREKTVLLYSRFKKVMKVTTETGAIFSQSKKVKGEERAGEGGLAILSEGRGVGSYSREVLIGVIRAWVLLIQVNTVQT